MDLDLEVVRLNGKHASLSILVPDEPAALILKVLAWDIRHKAIHEDSSEAAERAQIGPPSA